MDILFRLKSEEEWENYYSYKLSQGNMTEDDEKDLYDFIFHKEYIPTVEAILKGENLAFPQKKLINKSKTGKKRSVYIYNRKENYVLKLLAFLLREYDGIFAPNLYSFRKDSGVKKAVSDILHIPNLSSYYVYKLDISNYFNSVDVATLLPMLANVLKGNKETYEFIKVLLQNPYVIYEGSVIEEEKGIMAGVPISGFLANLYLMDLDIYFYERNIPYMRYSDDIIVFAKDINEIEKYIECIKDRLAQGKLQINEEKEILTYPGNKWIFLGFSYEKGVIDVSPVAYEKLKAKMRRKARGLSRWASKKNIEGIYAAKSFVKQFNAKLYDNPIGNELTWSRWYFPIINTDVTLKRIDRYMQDCIRFLAANSRTKSRYNFRYEDIKALGYRSLVNEYYKAKEIKNK